MNGRSRGCLAILILFGILLVLPFLWRQVVNRHYGLRIYEAASAPPQRTAIVFGAAVLHGGQLSTVLRDRMDTAIQLYEQGVVERLLVSGDGAFASYDEPGAMKAYAMRRGVPERDILSDPGGRRTYDSCYRARDLFDVEDAILVTQRFHLPRALFLCDQLNIAAIGVAADQRPYRAANWYEVREIMATMVALGDAIRQPEPAVTTLLPATNQGNG